MSEVPEKVRNVISTAVEKVTEKPATYVITYDISKRAEGRRKFYRHLNKLLKTLNAHRSGDSVIVARNLDSARELYYLIEGFAFRCTLFKGEILLEKGPLYPGKS